MILPGATLLPRQILTRTVSQTLQTQPCGVDLTLARVLTWAGAAGAIDFSNTRRCTAPTTVLFPKSHNFAEVQQKQKQSDDEEHAKTDSIHLSQGSYLLEFNERVAMPLDCMGQLFPRSSLWRSGAVLHAGVVDAGYEGALGGLLQVLNPAGLRLWENARVAQMVVSSMEGTVEKGYEGVYQGSERVG
ncbi:deoxyuridine 5'-triphosphate nucleotidohydrolase [Lasiodiplodia theobromae]|nr:deoxyuridine 5'-triphosphate nucleotidohydrolase [Lasiodiplodia theobromae]